MTVRLRFWLRVMDLAHAIGYQPLYLWAVGRASDATDWGPEIDTYDGGPW